MVKYGISGRARIRQMYNTKEHCGMFFKDEARNNMRVVMDRVNMRTSESIVLDPSIFFFYVYGSVHHNIFYEITNRCSSMQSFLFHC